jgi:putative transposase
VKQHRAEHAVVTMCELLGVSTSGFYAWLKRGPSARDRRDKELAEMIHAVHQASRGTYGSPRVHAELKALGERVGRKRVARLMREAGLRGVSRRKTPTTTTRSKTARPAPDLVDRDFEADGLNQLWVADITYVPTRTGFTYLAVVLDAFSRRVIGWAMADHLRTQLVADALEMAVDQRDADSVIHHSDQRCQYTSIEFGKRCRRHGVRPSMGSVGDCYDNALCESFFATLECELIERNDFADSTDAQRELFAYIEGWYNPSRRHSSINYLSPMTFEKRRATQPAHEAAI